MTKDRTEKDPGMAIIVPEDQKPKSVLTITGQLETEDIIAARLYKQRKDFEAVKAAIDKRRNDVSATAHTFRTRARALVVITGAAAVAECQPALMKGFRALGITGLEFNVDVDNWDTLDDPNCYAKLTVASREGRTSTTVFSHIVDIKRSDAATKLLKEVEKLTQKDGELRKLLEDRMKAYGDVHQRREEARLRLLAWKAKQDGGEEIADILDDLNFDTPEEQADKKHIAAVLSRPLPALTGPKQKK